MLRVILPSRSLALAVCVLSASWAMAADAAAQMEFEGIRWGTPAREVSARLEGSGYRLRGVDQEGDWMFDGRDGSVLLAVMDSTGLVEVVQVWKNPPEPLPARFQRLGDSLRAVLGEAGEQGDRYFRWRRGEENVHLSRFLPDNWVGGAMVTLFHSGPDEREEASRRSQAWLAAVALDPNWGSWTRVSDSDGWVLSVNTHHYQAMGDGVYRARLRDLWFGMPLRLDDGRKYASNDMEVDLDCGAMRLRKRRTVLGWRDSPLAGTERADADARWHRPAPDTREGVGLPAACATLARLHQGQP